MPDKHGILGELGKLRAQRRVGELKSANNAKNANIVLHYRAVRLEGDRS
jgi:hypothetical protein